jgi:hypothetical protein
MEKISCNTLAWVWMIVLLFTLTARFGKKAIEWLLVKMHRLFTDSDCILSTYSKGMP